MLEHTDLHEGLIRCPQLAQSAGEHCPLLGLPYILWKFFTRKQFAALIPSWLGQDLSF